MNPRTCRVVILLHHTFIHDLFYPLPVVEICISFNIFLLRAYVQMKDLMILLEVHTMLHPKSCIDLIVWKQIYGALV